MAGRVVYLEIDDEITSAASRIRDSTSDEIALVLPAGSRVATSRINFRLLARDALGHDKRLAIVAADPGARALAASAGLPAFGSVAEYESSQSGRVEPDAASRPSGGAAPPIETGRSRARRPRQTAELGDPAETLGLVEGSDDATGPAGRAGETIRTRVPPGSDRSGPRPAGPHPASAVGLAPAGPRSAPVLATARRGIRPPWVIGAALVALTVLVAGVGAYVLLPSATVVVTPRTERLGPLQITVVADPTAAEPDAQAGVVPATEISIPLSADQTFSATGKRVELTKATGAVRFLNFDFVRTKSIPAGSIVSTREGIRFRTDAAVTIARADRVGAQLFPSRATVTVTAVSGGPDGNVEADTIVVVPSGENRLALTVSNPEPTKGGARDEFARITQDDVDGAMAALNLSLAQAFQEAMRDPALETDGATPFPSTGRLGPAVPDVDPDSLVGQEVETFALSLAATGTVIAVRPEPVRAIAEDQLRTTVDPEHQLVAGSVEVTVGEAVVVDQSVRFPVTATAEQVAILDPERLRTAILGRTIDDARAILEAFGQVDLSVSPDWTGSVPGFESRVTVRIDQAVPIETAAPSPAESGAP